MKVRPRTQKFQENLWSGLVSRPVEYMVLGVGTAAGRVWVMISPAGDDIHEYPLSQFEIVDAAVSPNWQVFARDDADVAITFPELDHPYLVQDLADSKGYALDAMYEVFHREGIQDLD